MSSEESTLEKYGITVTGDSKTINVHIEDTDLNRAVNAFNANGNTGMDNYNLTSQLTGEELLSPEKIAVFKTQLEGVYSDPKKIEQIFELEKEYIQAMEKIRSIQNQARALMLHCDLDVLKQG